MTGTEISGDMAMAMLGAREWKPNRGPTRYYLDWPALVGLEVHRYGTGNISSAMLDGESISNSSAQRLLQGKAWIAEGRLFTQDISDDMARRLAEAVARVVARRTRRTDDH